MAMRPMGLTLQKGLKWNVSIKSSEIGVIPFISLKNTIQMVTNSEKPVAANF